MASQAAVLKFLEGKDGSVTMADIEKLDKDQKRRLQNAFYEYLKKNPDQKSDNKTLEDKNSALLNFLLDTQAACKRVGNNTSQVIVQKNNNEKVVGDFLGSPRFYTTYRDESLNGVIAKIARSTHRGSLMRSAHMYRAEIDAEIARHCRRKERAYKALAEAGVS